MREGGGEEEEDRIMYSEFINIGTHTLTHRNTLRHIHTHSHTHIKAEC